MTTPLAPPVVRVQVSTRQAVFNRWRTWRIVFVITILAAIFVGLSMIGGPVQNTVDYDPENRNGNGTQALARVLADQGVSNHVAMNVGNTANLATENSTIVVTPEASIDSWELEQLLESGAHVVLIDPDTYAWSSTLIGVDDKYNYDTSLELSADCELSGLPPRIQAEDYTSYRVSENQSQRGVTLCYADDTGPYTSYAFVSYTDDTRRLSLVGAANALTNRQILESDNAAFALWLLGEQEDLYWVTEFESVSETDSGSPISTFPDWFNPMMTLLTITAIAAMLWRGRRFGRLASENLPVTVRPGETVLGRGRLCQRAHAQGHAAAALRAGTVTRLSRRLKFGRNAEPAAVIEAIAIATGRPYEVIGAMIYGPPPTTDDQLIILAAQLEDLEHEVQFL